MHFDFLHLFYYIICFRMLDEKKVTCSYPTHTHPSAYFNIFTFSKWFKTTDIKKKCKLLFWYMRFGQNHDFGLIVRFLRLQSNNFMVSFNPSPYY